MKKLLIAIAALLVIGAAAIVVVPRLIPLETYKAQLAERVRAATGRELEIAGDIRLSILPRIEIEVDRLSFANPQGSAEPQMATLAALALELRWLPLLKGEVAVDRFVLIDPVINLEVDRAGRPNWAFEGAGTQESGTAGAAGGGPELAGLSVGDVRLVNGRLTWRDAATDRREEVTGLDVTVVPTGADGRTGIAGQATWRGRRLDLDLAIDDVDRLLAGEAVGAAVTLAGAPLALRYEGSLTLGEAMQVGGDTTLTVPSVRGLLEWLGTPVEMAGDGLGRLAVSGRLDVRGKSVAFTEARIEIDGMKTEGDLEVNLLGRVPYVRARLAADRLDLNRYLAPADETPAPAAVADAGPGDWSDAPIDVAGLAALNADIDLRTDAILVRDIKVGRTVLGVRLKDGRLVADLKELALYEGRGAALVVLDGRGMVPAIQARFRLAGLQVEPLLRDAAGFDRLTGTAETRIGVRSKGTSERGMISALEGGGAVHIGDGAIRGVDIGAMIRNVKSAFAGGAASGAAKTDFAELAGSFTIRDGIVRNDDLRLLAPLFRLAGKGRVPLPPRTLSYRLEPKVAATAEGQGGRARAAGLMVPVVVEGPWHDLSYKPDLAGLIGTAAADPGKVLETAKGLKAGGAEAVKGVLGGLTGGGTGGGVMVMPAPPPAPGETAAPKPAAPALAPLKKLLGN